MKEKLHLKHLFLTLLLTISLFLAPLFPSLTVSASEKASSSLTIKAGETITITQDKDTPYTFKWTAPKAGYFNFEFKNQKSKIYGEPYSVPYCDVSVKINGKKEIAEGNIITSRTDNSMTSMYFNCDKGTKVEITYAPTDSYSGTLTSDFKLNFKAPKYAVGLKNRSRKTATKLKLNKKYTTVAKRDLSSYNSYGNANKTFHYSEIRSLNIDTFNKYAKNYDIDWYEFKAPKKGSYLFTTPSTVTVYATNKKGKAYMGGNSIEYSNKKKLSQHVYLKKGEKVYFAVIPLSLHVPNKKSGYNTISDGYLYTCQIKYSKKLTKITEGN